LSNESAPYIQLRIKLLKHWIMVYAKISPSDLKINYMAFAKINLNQNPITLIGDLLEGKFRFFTNPKTQR